MVIVMSVSRYELKRVLADLKGKFSESKLKRATRRVNDVQQVSIGTWNVIGNPKLGDQYSFYTIDYLQLSNTYSCTCQNHGYGEHRSICTHIIAVIIWRRLQKEETGKFIPDPKGIEI